MSQEPSRNTQHTQGYAGTRSIRRGTQQHAGINSSHSLCKARMYHLWQCKGSHGHAGHAGHAARAELTHHTQVQVCNTQHMHQSHKVFTPIHSHITSPHLTLHVVPSSHHHIIPSSHHPISTFCYPFQSLLLIFIYQMIQSVSTSLSVQGLPFVSRLLPSSFLFIFFFI